MWWRLAEKGYLMFVLSYFITVVDIDRLRWD